MSQDAPVDKRRRADAARAALDLMRDRGLSNAEVERLSGLSENIVRDMLDTKGKSHNKSSWMALCGALECKDHLVRILNGEADASVPFESPMERRLAEMANGMAEIGALRADVATLKDIIRRIDEKIDVIIDAPRSQGGAGT